MPLRYYLLALCVCGIHALATAADYEADRAAGHRTFAAAFGRRAAAAFACATFAIAIALGDFYGAAVRVFLSVGFIATLLAAIVAHTRVVAVACTAVFCGFLIAAVCHMCGW
jgi:4-hydroxybenzoate polyprenyltransferase